MNIAKQKFVARVFGLLVLAILSMSSVVFAVSTYDPPLAASWSISTVPEFLLLLVDLIFLVGMPIIVLFLVYAGFLFVTAGGNESQISKARTAAMWCIIGAVVLLGSKGIAMAIKSTILTLQ